MNQWYVFLAVAVVYVNVFNAVANVYFDADQHMTWTEFYRRFVPPTDFHVRI